jgi:hypothetical protein
MKQPRHVKINSYEVSKIAKFIESKSGMEFARV